MSDLSREPRGEREEKNKHVARMEEIGSRLAVDADGYVWWVHDDGTHSMVRTNPDNKPTPMPFTFFERVPDGAMTRDQLRGERVFLNRIIADLRDAEPELRKGRIRAAWAALTRRGAPR